MDILAMLSQQLAGLVDAAAPSLVRVEAGRRLPASGVVWAAEGVIVTAHHVVERDESISVGLDGERTVPGSLVGRDPTTDVAVLRVQATDLPPAAWTAPDGLRVGQLILALGRPGRTVRARLGIVSAFGGEWRTPAGGEIGRYLEVDTGIVPGFSGGALVDAEGKVRGLVTAGLLPRAILGIPTPTLRRVVDTLLAHGRVRRGYLGVGAQPVRLPEPVKQQVHQDTGLLLVAVEPDGPADHAGLTMGDALVALEGKPVRDVRDLAARLTEDRIGTPVPVRIVRAGQVQDLTIVVGERR